MKSITWIASTLIATASVAAAHGEPSLAHEHAGSLFSRLHGSQCYGSGVLHDGNSTGTIETIDGGQTVLHAPY